MINLYFNAEKQILTRTDREDLASNSREIHKCNFTLSNDWDDMQITAVFKYMGRKWDVLLNDNACTVPAEVLEGQEGFTVGLYGTNGDQVITSTLITVPVSKGANAGGGGNAQITPSMFDQIMAKIEEIEEREIDVEEVNAIIAEYLEENPIETLTEADVEAIVAGMIASKQDTIQFAVMPEASENLLGKTYQYLGGSNANYTEGHWYKCVENEGVYSWKDIDIIPFVTPEMFGAKGDGITDDTLAVTEALKRRAVIGNGVYAISSPIYAQLEANSHVTLTLKAIAPMNYTLWLDAKGSEWGQLVRGNFNIKIDCNLMAVDGLRVDRFSYSTLEVVVKNFAGTALSMRYTDELECGGNVVRLSATNTETENTVSPNATALKAGQDEIYYVTAVDVKKAVDLAYGGNQFVNLHAWASTLEWFEKSVILEINTDALNVIETFICDTMQVIFKLDNSQTLRYPKLNITNFIAYNNRNVVDAPVYVWWLKDTSSFAARFRGLTVNEVHYKNVMSWSAGTIPNILVGDSAQVTDIKDTPTLWCECSVVTFERLEVTDLNYLVNCKDCRYVFNNTPCVINAEISAGTVLQRLDGYRASAHRMRPGNTTTWDYPWVDNSFNQRSFIAPVTFVSGTLTYELKKIEGIAGLIGTSFVAVAGSFMGVTSQPKIYVLGDTIYVNVTEDWISENTGTKTFYGTVLTNGAIA